MSLVGKYLFYEEENFSQLLKEYGENDGVSWSFIPANFPHFGGIWEAGVKAAIHHLVRIAGVEPESMDGKEYTLEIKQDGNKYTIKRTIGGSSTVINFTLNESFKEDMFGKQFESVATLENNVLKVSSPGDRRRYYVASEKGLEVKFESPKGKAAMRYKRI